MNKEMFLHALTITTPSLREMILAPPRTIRSWVEGPGVNVKFTSMPQKAVELASKISGVPEKDLKVWTFIANKGYVPCWHMAEIL